MLSASLSFSQMKAIITTLAFFIVGFLILVRTTHTNPIGIAARLIIGFTAVRLASSYWDYHRGFVEGLWPIVWTAVGLFGAYRGYRIGRRTAANGTRP